ncbi:hypothetical protein KDM87_04495 [Undibacterium sp. FT147W]|uniref:Uncharacterized protein n=1 Tax=Undibacterium rivi TaxID=2828729 RepID=A0ABS5GZF4_9BURK|nr:hypothetical protein [Undibacterium rivi]MBR7791846.1 hypothetical protein [Undibacterium rivi]
MKICTVWGDMSSDKSSENYPTDLFCDECFSEMRADEEDSRVVSSQEDDGSYGDTCSNCGKTAAEEIEEQST